ncbi:MAG: sensor domain-containing diguanylate cyclase [Thermodesulfovibrionales bacterium]
MGNFIQKVFQGRGDKKGQGFRIKRGIPLLFIVLTWLGLWLGQFKDFYATNLLFPYLWFSFASLTLAICATFHFIEKRKLFAIEFLFSIALIYAGLIHSLNLSWLKLAYFPFIVSIAVFYNWGTIIPLSLLITALGLKAFLARGTINEEIAFSISLLLTAIISSLIFNMFRKEKEKALATLKTIKDTARDIAPGTVIESPGSDAAISHYFASMLKTDEEIKELLLTIKQAVLADSVNFFVPHHNNFTLRSSTEKKGDIIITGKGIIAACLKDKKTFYSGEVNEKKLEIGYMKKGKISSVLAIAVMEGAALVGVLTVDSSRYTAFSEPERNTLNMFTAYLVRILERERIYPKITRDYNGLKILNEESSNLVSSLDINVIAEKLCEGADKIASSQVFLFISKGKKFELIHYRGNIPVKKNQFDLKGTFINMAVENIQQLYIADMTNYQIPVMPFKTEDISSIMALPLLYENKLLGLFVMLSGKKDFLDTFQRELLKVMCNQASTSIANAKLHAEIEKLATTDGLTTLFNHRIFQEKLSEKFKELNRYSEPTSLLLIDIDFFKKVNDTYGHPVGDLVLKGVSKIIKETIRDIDIPARYGGEEFAAILPKTDTKGARNIAERLRTKVMDTSFSADSVPFNITLSIGIATSPGDAKSKEDLIEKADQALYYAKHNGRNKSVPWSEVEK